MQSLEEYIKGRLQLGGCFLWIIGIVIAIIFIVNGISNFINDFSIVKLLMAIFVVGFTVLVFIAEFKS